MSPKVMVIGLDGATLDLMKPLADQGVMPNFSELLKKGCSGVLKSTSPPYTPPAWSSFYTGANPGKHGIYGFTWFNPETRSWELPSSKIIGAKKLWQILNEQGLSTGLINLPLTYPPERVDGFMITGMMTPEKAKSFVYPESLASEISALPHPYIVDVPVVPIPDSRNTNVVKRVHAALKGRRDACLHLIEDHPCDLMMAVFVAPDRLQHVYWKYIDQESQLYDTAEGEAFRGEILDCYRTLDETIGDIMAAVGDDCRTFFISDHGFCELRSEFFLNNWLAREGLFSIGSSSKWMISGGRKIRKLVPKGLLSLLSGNLAEKIKGKGLNMAVDWDNTVAYAHEQGLFMNTVLGKDDGKLESMSPKYMEIRSSIAEKLMDLRHPKSGEKMVDTIAFKEDIYQGHYFDRAPDIVPVLDNYRTYIYDGFLRNRLIVDHDTVPNGIHHPDGLFLAYGPDIAESKVVDNAAIIDIAPTIIHSLGLGVPENMDGRVLADVFQDSFMKKNPVRGSASGENGHDNSASVYTQEESDEIEEQLRGMGYIS